jgi:actin-related protein 9
LTSDKVPPDRRAALTTALGPALTTYLAPFLVSSSDIPTDVQPTKVRLLSIPDYFVNYKGESGDLAPFLGASMAAKVGSVSGGTARRSLAGPAVGSGAECE